MNKFIKGLVVGSILTTLLTTSVFAATGLIKIDAELNKINLSLNDKVIVKANEDLKLSNGSKVPNSIFYKGTAYLPANTLANALGQDISWNSKTNTISLKNNSKSTIPAPSKLQKKVDRTWVVSCNLSDLPVSVNAENGMSVSINSLKASTGGVSMNITMKNNSDVSDKGNPAVSVWEFFDGTKTLKYISSDDIFYENEYLRCGQEITGNVMFSGMTEGSKTLTFYGSLWQYLDIEDIKVIINLDK